MRDIFVALVKAIQNHCVMRFLLGRNVIYISYLSTRLWFKKQNSFMLKTEDEMSTTDTIIDARIQTFLNNRCTPEATIIRLVTWFPERIFWATYWRCWSWYKFRSNAWESSNSPTELNPDPKDLPMVRSRAPEKATFPASNQCGDTAAPPHITVYSNANNEEKLRINH